MIRDSSPSGRPLTTRWACALSFALTFALLAPAPATAVDQAFVCQKVKLKAAAVLTKCRLKAIAKAEGSGESPDFSKCEAKLDRVFARAEEKAGNTCPSSEDSQEVLTHVAGLTNLLNERLAGRSVCGNGVLDLGEECDGADFANLTCRDLGHVDGELACHQDCTLDLSGCGGGGRCGDRNCRENQICRIHEIAVPYCADTCSDIACPNGQECALVPVRCITEPCPPVARCIPSDPCRALACEEGQVCRIWEPTDQPYCVDTCEICEEGETCTFNPVVCVTDPCPPIVTCDPVDPCEELECQEHQVCEVDEGSGRPFCRDTCRDFPCGQGLRCELVDVVCITAPCPPVARCLPPEPCDALTCDAWQECRIDDATGEAYCADTCNEFPCRNGYHCELQDVFCVRAPCPPVARCQPDPEDVCELPAVEGPCRAVIPRWYFNDASGMCERFRYGGCGGNRNNFQTLDECEHRCPPDVDTCRQRPDAGDCAAVIPRWYFDEETRKCHRFIYSGCGGNQNNFATLQECEQDCGEPPSRCELPKEQGPCDAVIPRWFFNAETNQCEDFVYGGCGGNGNNFRTKHECEHSCSIPTCEQPQEVGPCDAVIPRWYFNQDTEQCEAFNYGGCGGNDNNFETVEKCERQCQPTCGLPPDPGPCTESIERWFYDKDNDRCEPFNYGGCEGNANNFATREECSGSCGGDPCDLQADPGPCDAAIPRWTYNTTTGECETFLYGGCGGNDNNFTTEQSCQEVCQPN